MSGILLDFVLMIETQLFLWLRVPTIRWTRFIVSNLYWTKTSNMRKVWRCWQPPSSTVRVCASIFMVTRGLNRENYTIKSKLTSFMKQKSSKDLRTPIRTDTVSNLRTVSKVKVPRVLIWLTFAGFQCHEKTHYVTSYLYDWKVINTLKY